jgi:hypothetical protein
MQIPAVPAPFILARPGAAAGVRNVSRWTPAAFVSGHVSTLRDGPQSITRRSAWSATEICKLTNMRIGR